MATGGGTVLTDEKRNYVRVVLLVTDVATKAVREIFDKVPDFAPPVLTKNLHSKRTSPEMRTVPPFLKKILFPSEHESKIFKSDDFDVTMMTALVDKLYTPPSAEVASWDDTKDLIKVIKDKRNILAHSKSASLCGADFTTIWNDVTQAILDMVDVTSKPSFQQEIHDVKHIAIGNEAFLKAVQNVYDFRKLNDQLEGVQATQQLQQTTIVSVQQGQTEMKKAHVEMKKEQGEMKSTVEGIQAGQTEMKKAHVEMKKEQAEMKSTVEGIQAGQTEMKSTVEGIQTGQTEMKSTVEGIQASVEGIQIHLDKLKIGEALSRIDFGLNLMKYLKDYYKKYRAGVQCNPMKPNDTMPLKDIYINLVWIKDYHQSDKKTLPFKHYREIFQRHPSEKEIEKLITRILVQGKAGVGKTTFSKVLVNDWANESEPYLKRFEAIFLLTMRNVKPEQSLVEIVKEQLLRRQPELVEGLKDYIENTDKCLFVFDGLDELGTERSQEIDDIISGFYLNNACLLITSRPWLVQDLAHTDQGIDQHVRIEGFDPQNVVMFISKFFANIYYQNKDSERVRETSSKLFNEITNRKLFDLVKIPLILNMVCLLFHHENDLPNTLYKLYKKIRELLYKKGTKKSQHNVNDLHEILIKLGKLAFEGLLKENDQLFFEYDEVIALVGEKAFEIGLISCETMKGRMENDTQVSFVHKSFQENLAAYYVGQNIEKQNEQPWEEMKNDMSTVEKLRNKALLLEFMSGESLVLCGKIQKYLDVMILEAFSNGYNYSHDINEDVNQILGLHSKFLRNAQSTLHPGYIPYYISCDKELERFAQSSKSVPWIYLRGEKYNDPFCFTERTVSLFSQFFDNNTRPCSVYIGENCKCNWIRMKVILQILKTHSNVKYKYIVLGGTSLGYINNYGKESWEELFQVLLGIKELLGLELQGCDIPVTVLQEIGQIVNDNANTLFVLNLAYNSSIPRHFHMITKEVTTQDPLVLSMLYLACCLNSSDSKSLSGFLQKTKNMKCLNLWDCKCEVSQDVIELHNLRWLRIGRTVDRYTNRGMNLKTILSNLHQLEHLEELYACLCGINDSEIETLQLEKLNKIRDLDLEGNVMSDQVKSQIEEKCERRRIHCWV